MTPSHYKTAYDALRAAGFGHGSAQAGARGLVEWVEKAAKR
jgi:hypothetical protein